MVILLDGRVGALVAVPAVERELPPRGGAAAANAYLARLQRLAHPPYPVDNIVLRWHYRVFPVTADHLDEARGGRVDDDLPYLFLARQLTQPLVVLLVGFLKALGAGIEVVLVEPVPDAVQPAPYPLP